MRPEVKLAAGGSLTTRRAETIGQEVWRVACGVPQTVSDYSHCKGKQIAMGYVFYSRSRNHV